MCDQDHFEDDRLEYEAGGLVTRRQFGVLVAAGVALALPKVINAVAVTEMDVTIKTPDGNCDAYFVHPATGAAAAVLVWPDIFGLRPAFRDMGKRLAETGYSVLVVNPFYRTQKAPTAPKGGATPIQEVLPLAKTLSPTTHMTDAKAFVAWLDQQQSVAKNKKVGTQGYCMGGQSRSRGRDRLGPRRRTRHDGCRQPTPAGVEDQGVASYRDRVQRRQATADGEGRLEGNVREVGPGGGDRSVFGRARLVPAGFGCLQHAGRRKGVEPLARAVQEAVTNQASGPRPQASGLV